MIELETSELRLDFDDCFPSRAWSTDAKLVIELLIKEEQHLFV